MSEEPKLTNIAGDSTGKYGMERTIHSHKKDSNLLVGVEHPVPLGGADWTKLSLSYYTNNILYHIFPDNFAKVNFIGSENETNFSVVKKVKTLGERPDLKSREAKERFLSTIGVIFPPEFNEELRTDEHNLIIDFGGDRPNVLVDENDNPVFIDKLNPELLRHIDPELLKEKVGARKAELLTKLIDKTLAMQDRYREMQRMMDDLYSM